MPEGFMTLVIICAVFILVLRLIKASVKLIAGAVVLAVVVWLVINYLPTLGVL